MVMIMMVVLAMMIMLVVVVAMMMTIIIITTVVVIMNAMMIMIQLLLFPLVVASVTSEALTRLFIFGDLTMRSGCVFGHVMLGVKLSCFVMRCL